MKNLFIRHQPKVRKRDAMAAGIGSLLAIFAIGGLSMLSETPLLMAPFGATCVLLFAVPESPLSQPANVIGGHLLAAVISLVLVQFLPPTWWALAIGVGLTITAMTLLRVTHPPAGADPIVIMLAAPGVEFLLTPVLAGSIILIYIAKIAHRTTGTTYPLQPPAPALEPAPQAGNTG